MILQISVLHLHIFLSSHLHATVDHNIFVCELYIEVFNTFFPDEFLKK